MSWGPKSRKRRAKKTRQANRMAQVRSYAGAEEVTDGFPWPLSPEHPGYPGHFDNELYCLCKAAGY